MMNILVVRLGGIGDVVIITPALKALKKIYPQSRIWLVTNHYSAEVVRGAPYVDELITFTELFSAQHLSDFLKPKIINQFYALLSRFRKTRRRFNPSRDTAVEKSRRGNIFVCFHSFVKWSTLIKPLFLAILSKASIRAGLNTFNRGFFLTVKTPDDPNKHLMSRCMDVVKQIACRTGNIQLLQGDIQPEVWLQNQDYQYADDFFAKTNIKQNTLLVGIHPGGNPRCYLSQCWQAERFVKVANSVAEKYEATVLLSGGKTDQPILNKILPLLNRPPLLLPQDVSIKQFSAIISRCNLFISNDTGPMHIAVAMKVPTIGLFGGGDSMYGLYPPEFGFIGIRKDLPCSPCYHLPKCASPECLDKITVEEVMQAVDTQIEKWFGRLTIS